MKFEMWSVLSEFAERLPSPFTLVSPDLGLHIKSIHLLPSLNADHVVRSICMANASLFELVNSQNPVLSLKFDSAGLVYFSKMVIMLKPKDFIHNYTCVYYDENEGGWSTRGIRRVDVNYHGFVRCETNHVGVFSLLPENFFFSGDGAMRDLSVLLPTVTTFISLICSVFLLFTAAIQKNKSLDFALLVHLFFVFMVHIVHLVMLIAPQVGDPFSLTPALHLILQFSIISVTTTLYLVLTSIRTICEQFEQRHFDLFRAFEGVDWLFIANYLTPAVVFSALCISHAIWNIYVAGVWRSRHRGSSERFLSLAPATQASLVSIVMLGLLASLIILFWFREYSTIVAILFSLVQILYSCSAFLFAGCLFRWARRFVL
ncbi:hypothetical protein Angca_001476, partial [Angiostrongylus cantonensis]